MRAAWLAWLALNGAAATAQLDASFATPEAVVDSLHAGLIEAAANENLASVDERFAVLLPLVESTHDIPYIAELSVRREWQTFEPEQQRRFIEAFAELSAMTYAARFPSITAEALQRVGSQTDSSGRVQVSTRIERGDGTSVTLDYQLHAGQSGWQIINIIADGVSDLALKRSEYRRILSEGSVEDLIDYVEHQTEELRSL
jgi:phospholipid transport system substrate-binding protein